MKQILIIEDDPSIAELVQDYLGMNGFAVEWADNGLTGLQLALEHRHDLIILDLMLPGMDGLSVLQQIHDDLSCPLLIVSAKQDEFSKIKGFSLGADDYITKPFSLAELLARVHAHVNKYERLRERFGSSEPENAHITINGLRLETGSHRVWRLENEIVLTTKEFELLQFLMTNPNHVYKREELFERIWGMDSLGDAQTVTVHIARLREKIEPNPAKPQYIETIWGSGYRFRV